MNMSSKGVAVVTGASSGIGAAYARSLARRGYDLIIIARRADRLDSLAQDITGETGRLVETRVADLTKPDDLANVADLLRSDARITLLVNNAGIAAVTPLVKTDPRLADEIITLNVGALTQLTYAAVPAFVARGAGTIVNISSVVALAPDLINGVYSGSKAFVLAFSEGLRAELDGTGVTIQVVLPGAIATDIWENSGLSVSALPDGTVMETTAMVEAALAGLDQGEFLTAAALEDVELWETWKGARRNLVAQIARAEPAARYRA